MSAYPMTIRSLSMHQETKSYHLLLVSRADGKTIFVRRWGKKGAFGEVKPELHPNIAAAEIAWSRLENSKTSGGYRPEGRIRVEEVDSASQLKLKMGLPVFNKIGKDAINWLDPDIDTSKMREVDLPRVGEDGRLTGEDIRKADLSAAIAAQKAAEQEEAARVLKNNPNFGRF